MKAWPALTNENKIVWENLPIRDLETVYSLITYQDKG